MPTTGPGTSHLHKTRGGNVYDLTDTVSGSPHTHTYAATDLTPVQDQIAALTARVAALEKPAPPPPPPPPPPPTTTDPQWALDLRAAMGSGITYTDSIRSGAMTGRDLNALIAAHPDGASPTSRTRLTIAPGSTVNMTGTEGVYLAGRRNLELILTGVALNFATDGSSNLGSGIFTQDSVYVAVRRGTFQGQNPATATPNAAASTDEQKSGAAIRSGSRYIEFDGITWLDLQGFGWFVSTDGGSTWPSDLWLHRCIVEGAEMGLGVVSGRNVLAEDNTFLDTTWFPFDFEPDTAANGYQRVLMQRNTITRFGWEALYQGSDGGHTHWLLAMNPADSALACLMDDLTFRDNIVTEGHVTGTPGPLGGQNIGGGGLLVRADKANVKSGVVITGNTSNQPRTRPGGSVYLASVNGLTLTGNKQGTVGHVPLVGADTSPSGTHTVTPNVT